MSIVLACPQLGLSFPSCGSQVRPRRALQTSTALRQRQTDAKFIVADWNWVNEREIAVPSPARVEWIYEFVYEAADPKVMGIGHAATRDFVSFLEYAEKDDFGNPNPIAMTGLRARHGEDVDAPRPPA